jgi:hypothetical protein
MWLLQFLPDAYLQYIVHLILLVGIVGTVIFGLLLNPILRFFPPLAGYYRLLQILSIGTLVAGVYFEGGYTTEMMWREKVAEAQAKIKEAEELSEQVNVQLDAERKKKQKVVKEYAIQIKERIIEKEKLIDAECKLDPEVNKIINDAAKNPLKEVKK